MPITRRRLLLASLAATAGLPWAQARAQEGEPFPVSASDERKIEYKYRRREIDLETAEPPGSIIVDPRKRFL